MKKRKLLILLLCIAGYLLVMGLAITAAGVIDLSAFLSILFFIPAMFVSDVCFALLPISIPMLLVTSGYTLIKKDYQKFNLLYAILIVAISFGLINGSLEAAYENSFYADYADEYASYCLVLIAIAILIGVIQIAKRKDTRLYLCTYVLGLMLYMIYNVANMLD